MRHSCNTPWVRPWWFKFLGKHEGENQLGAAESPGLRAAGLGGIVWPREVGTSEERVSMGYSEYRPFEEEERRGLVTS